MHEFAAMIELPDLGPEFPGPHPVAIWIENNENFIKTDEFCIQNAGLSTSMQGVKAIRAWEGGKFKRVPIFTVVDSSTIHAVRPLTDDPKGWSEQSKTTDMKVKCCI